MVSKPHVIKCTVISLGMTCILHRVDRNKRTKSRPERCPNRRDLFDLILTHEKSLYDQVVEDQNSGERETCQAVRVINGSTWANAEDAIGAPSSSVRSASAFRSRRTRPTPAVSCCRRSRRRAAGPSFCTPPASTYRPGLHSPGAVFLSFLLLQLFLPEACVHL